MLIGCIDAFDPPEVDHPKNYLVYDGYIQANGTDTSWVRLSFTQNVHDASAPTYLSNAIVQVENERGLIRAFQPHETTPGLYFLPPEYFSFAQSYRLTLSVGDKLYHSDWQKFTESPPIDSLTYEVKEGDGVQIYVHTHDPSNQARFYKWQFDETWEYFTALSSTLEVINGSIEPRAVPINICWDSRVSTRINLFTTAFLARDVVSYHPITYVAASTNKLLRTYSILVHQQSLTREAYDYWSELARNNETNGSIFDPFPSQLTGNIRSVNDPNEKVFGFFSGGTVQSKRIFVREYLGTPPRCLIAHGDTLSRDEILLSNNKLIVYETEIPGAYVVAPPECVDCRLQGGTIDRPTFWP